MRTSHLVPLVVALALAFATPGHSASLSDSVSEGKEDVMKGTIYGEVKKVQPDAVIVKANQKEVRLSLHESTHVGPVKEGDQVVAYVTPGGTTTSIQPLDSRWYR